MELCADPDKITHAKNSQHVHILAGFLSIWCDNTVILSNMVRGDGLGRWQPFLMAPKKSQLNILS